LEFFKANWKGLLTAGFAVALIVTSFIPALYPFHDQLLVLGASLGVGGTALFDGFIGKKKKAE